MIKPFTDNETASSIGDLAIENGSSRIVISGSVEITRDAEGLTRARALKSLADALVAELQSGDARRSIAAASTTPAAAVDQVDNPFA